MDLVSLLKKTQRLLESNSPAILTGLGVTGTLVTAYLAGKASFKAAEVLSYENSEMDTRDKIHRVWTFYIPAAVSAGVTVTAIVAANRIGTRRTAAMTAMYTLTQKAYEEYQEKIKEKLGTKKEQTARDEIAQDRVNKTPQVSREVFLTGAGDVLCFEDYTGRYFHSDQEALRKAQNDINRRVLHDGYASLSDFYELIGLPLTTHSDEVGWNTDNLLELQFTAVLSDGGQGVRPCISMNYNISPASQYTRLI